MATAKPAAEGALNYRSRPAVTLRAGCERFISSAKAPNGRVKTTGHAEIRQVDGTKDTLFVSFAMSVTGHPKDAPDDVAFLAECTVGYEVQFSQDQDDELPPALSRQLVAPIFFIASERCRLLIWSMGYPAQAGPLNLPPLTISSASAEKQASPANAARKRSRKPSSQK